MFIVFIGFVLTACNKSSNTFKVTFKFNNADPDVVMEVSKGNKITDPPIAKKYGCTFLNYRKGDTDFDLNTSIYEDTTLSAHYVYNEDELFKNRDNPSIRKGEDANLRVMSFNLLSSVFDYHPYHHGYDEKIIHILSALTTVVMFKLLRQSRAICQMLLAYKNAI